MSASYFPVTVCAILGKNCILILPTLMFYINCYLPVWVLLDQKWHITLRMGPEGDFPVLKEASFTRWSLCSQRHRCILHFLDLIICNARYQVGSELRLFMMINMRHSLWILSSVQTKGLGLTTSPPCCVENARIVLALNWYLPPPPATSTTTTPTPTPHRVLPDDNLISTAGFFLQNWGKFLGWVMLLVLPSSPGWPAWCKLPFFINHANILVLSSLD